MYQCKNFENGLAFDEVTNKSLLSFFFGGGVHSVQGILLPIAILPVLVQLCTPFSEESTN